jgi:hypothetical protein
MRRVLVVVVAVSCELAHGGRGKRQRQRESVEGRRNDDEGWRRVVWNVCEIISISQLLSLSTLEEFVPNFE